MPARTAVPPLRGFHAAPFVLLTTGLPHEGNGTCTWQWSAAGNSQGAPGESSGHPYGHTSPRRTNREHTRISLQGLAIAAVSYFWECGIQRVSARFGHSQLALALELGLHLVLALKMRLQPMVDSGTYAAEADMLQSENPCHIAKGICPCSHIRATWPAVSVWHGILSPCSMLPSCCAAPS